MPRAVKPRRTWKYSREFKREAVKMSLQKGVRIKDVAHRLDIHPFMLSRWRREYTEGLLGRISQAKLGIMNKQRKSNQHTTVSEVERLRQEVEQLKKENDLLKKWQRYLAEQRQKDTGSSSDTES